MISAKFRALTRPRRLPTEDAHQEGERLFVIVEINFVVSPEQVWTIGTFLAPIGILDQHVKREDFRRERTQ